MKKNQCRNRSYKMYIILTVILISLVVVVVWNTARFDILKPNIENIIFNQDEYQYLLNEYTEKSLEMKEAAYCMNGYIWEGNAVVNSISIPKQTQDEYNVMFDRCKGINNIGMIHIHPEYYCEFSETDYYSFGKSNVRVIGLICGENDFRIYAYTDLLQELEIGVKTNK